MGRSHYTKHEYLEMGPFIKKNMKNQIFWPLDHVSVVNTDSMTTDFEH